MGQIGFLIFRLQFVHNILVDDFTHYYKHQNLIPFLFWSIFYFLPPIWRTVEYCLVRRPESQVPSDGCHVLNTRDASCASLTEHTNIKILTSPGHHYPKSKIKFILGLKGVPSMATTSNQNTVN